MPTFSERLLSAIAEEAPRLEAISEQSAAAKPGGPGSWSKKQELGHLIDSATNNRVRFVTAALAGEYAGPSYEGMGWVDLGGYAETPWRDLIGLWSRLNRALVTVTDRILPDRLSAPCRIGGAAPVTLEFVIDDYILHMQHHLDHILARDHMTDYPCAAIGV
jgi:hypothetical protein